MRHEYWIRDYDTDEIVANYMGRDAREALVAFVRDSRADVGWPGHSGRGRTALLAEIAGRRYFADKV
jgi:hypothetical protein